MFMDDVRDRLRTKHYSYKTEQSYCGWIRRFIIWLGGTMPTEFQARIIEYVKRCPNRMASRWEIAQCAFPEKWVDMKRSQGNRSHGRGALIAHIRRASQTCDQLGRIPAKTQWDDDIVFYRGD